MSSARNLSSHTQRRSRGCTTPHAGDSLSPVEMRPDNDWAGGITTLATGSILHGNYRNLEAHLAAMRYAAERYGSQTFQLGDPFEPISELVARAEQWAERQWKREHEPTPMG